MVKFLIKNISDLTSITQTMPYQCVDCTYFLENEVKIPFNQSPKINHDDIFFCVDGVACTESPFGHTFPPHKIFFDYCQKNNIVKEKNYIFYDHKGIFSSPRVFLTFLAYGFKNIYVLDGGYTAADAFKYTHKPSQDIYMPNNKPLIINENPLPLFVNSDYVQNAISKTNHKIIDARSNQRFHGIVPEPRAGLLSGHIPTSLNLPFMDLLTVDKTYKSVDAIKKIFTQLGVTSDDTLIFSCGSGITACVVALAALIIGIKIDAIKIYDASWCEWGNGHFDIEKT